MTPACLMHLFLRLKKRAATGAWCLCVCTSHLLIHLLMHAAVDVY